MLNQKEVHMAETQTTIVYNKIKSKIESGEYSPAQSLPEAALAKEYGVSRNTIHRFRRESHQLSLPQKLCAAGDACRIRRAKFCFYFHTNHRSFLL